MVAPLCHHKAKVKLGPTGSFGRDALRRVLARINLLTVEKILENPLCYSALGVGAVLTLMNANEWYKPFAFS